MTTQNTKQRLREYKLGKDLKLGHELGRGGEGTIYAIVTKPQLVAKIYYKPTLEKTAKLRAMLSNPPPSQRDYKEADFRGKHTYIAWPTALVINERDECVGFTMPYIDMNVCVPLLKVYNPRDRREIKIYNQTYGRAVSANFSWVHLIRMAYNLSDIVEELHNAHYVIGDLNESNILVTQQALEVLVDCDSIQVLKSTEKGKETFFRSPVGKPEYTPPELQGKDFSLIDREQKHDNFSLAVLIFLLLMEGRHPYASIWQGEGDPPTLAQKIQAGAFPYNPTTKLKPPKNALPFKMLSRDIQNLMLKSFKKSKSTERPSATMWKQALSDFEKQLVSCPRVGSLHVYHESLPACPWCERMSNGIPDPFPWVPTYAGEAQPPPPCRIAVPKPDPESRTPTTGPTFAPGQWLLTCFFVVLCFCFLLVELYILNSVKIALFHAGPIMVIIAFAVVLILPFLLFFHFMRKFL